jgi:hypothetical protein
MLCAVGNNNLYIIRQALWVFWGITGAGELPVSGDYPTVKAVGTHNCCNLNSRYFPLPAACKLSKPCSSISGQKKKG